MTTRTNLIPNPSFETGTSGWQAATRSNTFASARRSGSYYALFNSANVYNTVKIDATAGLEYTASAYFSKTTDTSARNAAISIRFFDSGGTELSAPTVTLTPIATLDVLERYSSTRTAPAGTTHVEVWLHASASATTADGVLLEQSGAVGGYFDGDTRAAGYVYSWAGTVHNSASMATPTPIGRVNPIKNPSFETDITGWTFQSSTTLTRDTTEFLYGTASMKCVVGTPTRCAVYGTTGGAVANADSIPVSPGELVTISCYVKMTTTPVGLRCKIHWFTAAGAWISDSEPAFSTPTINTWTRFSATGQAPATARYYGVVLITNGGGTLYTDGWLAETSPIAGPYFDGDTTDGAYTHSWTGTAHASASTAVCAGTRTNLIINPSFETGVANWTGTSLTRNNIGDTYTVAVVIGGSYCMTSNGGLDYYSSAITATAGLDYTASGWMTRMAAAGRTAAVSLHFYDSGGAEIDAPTVTLTNLLTQNVQERRAVTRTAPAGTATAKLRIQASASSVAGDGFLLEESSYLDSYFDGDTKATTLTHAWTGTAHASTSTQVAGAPTDGTLVTVKSRESGSWISWPAVPRARVDRVWKVGNPKRWDGAAWVDLA